MFEITMMLNEGTYNFLPKFQPFQWPSDYVTKMWVLLTAPSLQTWDYCKSSPSCAGRPLPARSTGIRKPAYPHPTSLRCFLALRNIARQVTNLCNILRLFLYSKTL